jgi:DUF971 family protein
LLKPKEVRRTPQSLQIIWSDSRLDQIPLAHLRAQCTCAVCREFIQMPPYQEPRFERSRTITSLDLVGNYGLGVMWADSHRSIYAFDRLRALRNDPEREAG